MHIEQNEAFRAFTIAGAIMAAMFLVKANLPPGGADQENLRFTYDVPGTFNRSASSRSEADPDGARQRWLNIGNDPLKSGWNIVLELPEIVVTPGSNKSETAEKARQSLNKGLEEDDYAAVECKI